MSRLFGARLYADRGLLDDNEELWRKDTTAVLADIAAEKMALKVDNRTNLILLDEILGMDIQDSDCDKDIFEDHQDRVLRITLLNSDGSCDFSRITCFQELDGRFVKVHEYRYAKEAFAEDDMYLWMDYENKWIHTVNVEGSNGSEISWSRRAPVIERDRKIPQEQKKDTAHLPEWLSFSTRYTKAGGYYYCHNYGSLEKIDPVNSGRTFYERKILAEYHYEEEDGYYWECATPLCVMDDMIVVMRIQGKPLSSWRAINVRFFDLNLNLLREEQIPMEERLPQSNCFCYDRELDTIFLGRMSINLKTHNIVTCPVKIKEGGVLACLDERKNVYMISGHSLYVLSADMKLLSHHTIKGSLMNYYKNAKGNLRLITGSYFVEKASQLKAGLGIRIYEVVEKV